MSDLIDSPATRPALAWAGLRDAFLKAHPYRAIDGSARPWSRYVTPELEKLEGPYADFAAFEKWIAEMKEELTDSTLELMQYYAAWCAAMETTGHSVDA